jgi:hypothetical protein
MITTFLVFLGAAAVFGSAIMLLWLAEAPEGYEDIDGYHFGPEPEICGPTLLASPVSEYRDDVPNVGFAETQAERHGACVTWSSVGLR